MTASGDLVILLFYIILFVGIHVGENSVPSRGEELFYPSLLEDGRVSIYIPSLL
jgi:hypothetical protein